MVPARPRRSSTPCNRTRRSLLGPSEPLSLSPTPPWFLCHLTVSSPPLIPSLPNSLPAGRTMAASASLFAPCATLTAKLGAAAHPSSRRRISARRGRLSVVAVQTGPKKPSPSPSSAPGTEAEALQNLLKREYKYGFVSDFESFSIPKGLSEATVRRISELKAEPAWMLDFRLAAYRRFLTMVEPTWSDNVYAPVDLQSLCFYSAPKTKPKLNSLDEVDPEMLKTFRSQLDSRRELRPPVPPLLPVATECVRMAEEQRVVAMGRAVRWRLASLGGAAAAGSARAEKFPARCQAWWWRSIVSSSIQWRL